LGCLLASEGKSLVTWFEVLRESSPTPFQFYFNALESME